MSTKRITPQDIEANIIQEHYINLGAAINDSEAHRNVDLITICALVLKNGYTVIGESACVDPVNFDEAKGRKAARDVAIEKIWPLMGYHLKQSVYQTTLEPPKYAADFDGDGGSNPRYPVTLDGESEQI